MEKKITKTASVATVGSKGQIVIPQKIREIFEINPGDSVIFLADLDKGIALVKNDVFMDILETKDKKNG